MILPGHATYLGIKNLGSFLSEISFDDVSEIKIISYTGEFFLPSLFDQFQKHQTPPFPSIEILLQNPINMDLKSLRSVQESWTEEIQPLIRKGVKVSIRYHETPIIQEAISFELKNGNRSFCISPSKVYSGQKPDNSRLNCFFQPENHETTGPDLLHQFNFLWGKQELHTLVFSFDDTLFESMAIRMDAWYKTIRDLSQKPWFRKEYLDEEIIKSIQDQKLTRERIKEIVLKEQMDARILKVLFPNIHQEQLRQSIYNYRFSIREKLSIDQAKLYPYVTTTLENLCKDYQLAIVSNTSEKLINALLEKFELKPYFHWVLGRLSPNPGWKNMQSKSHNLLKLSRMTGIPLERMALVGNDQADFSSAQQLNIPFIEANMIAQSYGRESLIQYPKNTGTFSFSSFSQLPSLLNSLSIPSSEITERYLAQIR